MADKGAKNKPKGDVATRFKKGCKPGPGRPKYKPKELERVRITKDAIRLKLSELVTLDERDLKGVMEDPKATALDKWIASIVLQGISGGDQQRLNFIFDRLIGKVKEQIEHQVPRPTIVRRLDSDEVIELGSEQVRDNEE